jgi:hypothetical protein
MKLCLKYCEYVNQSTGGQTNTLAELTIVGSVPQIGSIITLELDENLPFDKAAMDIIRQRHDWTVKTVYHNYKIMKTSTGASCEEEFTVVLFGTAGVWQSSSITN